MTFRDLLVTALAISLAFSTALRGDPQVPSDPEVECGTNGNTYDLEGQEAEADVDYLTHGIEDGEEEAKKVLVPGHCASCPAEKPNGCEESTRTTQVKVIFVALSDGILTVRVYGFPGAKGFTVCETCYSTL